MTFSCDAERDAVVGAFVWHGLARGEKVLYLADGAAVPAVLARLRRGGVADPDRFVSQGQLTLAAALTTERVLWPLSAQIDRALAEGYPALRVTSEHGLAGGWVGGVAGPLPEYEAQVDRVCGGGRATAICQYDRRLLDDGTLSAVLEAHRGQAVRDPEYDDGVFSATPTCCPVGVRLAGQLDLTGRAGAARALGTAVRRAGPLGEVHVDLSGLVFADVAGLRLFADTAEQLRDQTLVLVAPQPLVAEMLTRLGWDRLARLRVVRAPEKREPDGLGGAL
ncbi:MAG TPA: MEDS domain-containing protein [Micromonosporaceae bacterium]|nr:MEDS domain-containing protein [Micromonosporaceae bacterium]